MMKRSLLAGIFLLLYFSSCVNESSDPDILPIEGKIIVEVSEGYDQYNSVAPPSIYIKLATEKIYGCLNYSIAAEYFPDRGTAEVFINGIAVPGICLTALGPAVAGIKTGLSEGEYTLRIRASGFVDEYSLTINKGFIRTDGDSTRNTALAFRQFNRYPERSFAYLCGTTLKDSSLCRLFIDTLRSVISLQQFEFPETGEIPYPLSTSGFEYNMPAKYYLYQNEADFDRIKSIMTSFVSSHPAAGAYISVINWLNKSFSIP